VRSRLTRPLALAVVVVIIAGGAFAYAAWSVSGSGQGSAKAATAANLSFANSTPQSALYPGGSSDVATTVTNPNPFPVHVSSITADSSQGTSGFAVDGAHSSCGLDALSFAAQTNSGSGWDIPAGGSLDIDLPGALSMTSAAVDACQGASFTVYLTATATSA
jgi:hypothetical protein